MDGPLPAVAFGGSVNAVLPSALVDVAPNLIVSAPLSAAVVLLLLRPHSIMLKLLLMPHALVKLLSGLRPAQWRADTRAASLRRIGGDRNKRAASMPLRTSVRLLRRSLLGKDDVHLPSFVAASREFGNVLMPFGVFSKPMQQATELHVAHLQPLTRQFESVRALLQHEQETSKHGPGGVLAKDSPAEAVLWLRRGNELWCETFRLHLQSKSRKFREEATQAYMTTISRYNGWVMRNAAKASMMLAPSWESVLADGRLLHDASDLDRELAAWIAAVRPVVERLTRLHQAMDLEDVRQA